MKVLNFIYFFIGSLNCASNILKSNKNASRYELKTIQESHFQCLDITHLLPTYLSIHQDTLPQEFPSREYYFPLGNYL